MNLRSLLFVSLPLSLALSTGCDHPPTYVKVEAPKDGAQPKAAASVSLPSPPSAQDFIIKEKNNDGTLRVQGLIEYKDKHINQEVLVKGKVLSISEDCDPGKAKKAGKSCPEPHMMIMDDEKNAEKVLLIVGHHPKFLKKAKIKEGEVFDFKGSYKLMGRGFTATEDGLMILASVGDLVVEEVKK